MKKPKPAFTREDAMVRRKQLVAAATRCLSRGGIAHFTIDQISREAGVSRGLINHHFDGIEDLLASVYETMTTKLHLPALPPNLEPDARLTAIVNVMFEPPLFAKASLRAWLALWGEVATNPRLKAAHRKSYDSYREAMGAAVADIAAARTIAVNSETLAIATIALIDGLWIEWCLDSSIITREAARDVVFDFLEARLGGHIK